MLGFAVVRLTELEAAAPNGVSHGELSPDHLVQCNGHHGRTDDPGRIPRDSGRPARNHRGMSTDPHPCDDHPCDDGFWDDDACYRAIETRDARFDGRLFTGVRSTGIYCRPVCPARTPKRENCRFFRSAAAAQAAGFRPCLRCRPETAPHQGAWQGSANTVRRALALIDDGALDGDGGSRAGVVALADRVGVGERQLRRLFRRHLDATPLGVAQTRRLLLAKHLLHETALPLTQVAMGAGYGSLRRFNECFRAQFGRPPGALRRAASSGRPATPAAGVSLTLRFRPPYDWDNVLAYLAARAIPGVEAVDGDGYRRSIVLPAADGSLDADPAQGRLAVRAAGGDRLRVDIACPDLRALPAILARLRRLLDLEADPAAIGRHLSRDPVLAPLVAARPGLRAPGAWDGFELAVRAILGQQITVAGATALAGRLVQAHGTPLPPHLAEPGLSHSFPAPQALAAAEIGTPGSGLGMPRARAAALTGLAAAAAADPRLFSPLGSLEQAVAALRALPGIGEWTAQYIALRQLREPDAFPAADIGLMRALQALEGSPERPSATALLARAEAWRPWRAYAALHLWSADLPAAAPAKAAIGPKEAGDDRRAA